MDITTTIKLMKNALINEFEIIDYNIDTNRVINIIKEKNAQSLFLSSDTKISTLDIPSSLYKITVSTNIKNNSTDDTNGKEDIIF